MLNCSIFFSVSLTSEEQTRLTYALVCILSLLVIAILCSLALGLNSATAKGKGKNKGKGKHDQLLRPLAWGEMASDQQWYVCEFRNGNLKKAKDAAERQYRPRSAETNLFQMIYHPRSAETDLFQMD